jgi:ankyrin repeat protein
MQIFKIIFDYSQYINLESKYIENYLPYLIELNQFNLFKEIIEKDNNRVNFIFSAMDIENSSLIALSINEKKHEFTSYLLSKNVDVNIEIKKKQNNEDMIIAPIHLAIINKDENMVELLINKGNTSYKIKELIVLYLLSLVKNNLIISDGVNPLQLAIKYNLSTKILDLIMNAKNVDIFKTSLNGSNLLHFASESDNLDIFKFLQEKGLDINNLTNTGYFYNNN